MARFFTATCLLMLLGAHVASARKGKCKDYLGGNGLDDLPSCRGGTDESWFNYDVELEKNVDACNERDSFILGALISEIVQELECDLPSYKQELFDGELCELPSLIPSDRRLVAVDDKKSLRRRLEETGFRYKGAGRRRRCSSNTERFLKEEATVEMVCSMADVSELGADLATATMEHANDSFEQVMELAITFYDEEKGQEHQEKAKKELDSCHETVKFSHSAAELTRKWCDQAKREKGNQELLDECFEKGEKAYKVAIDELADTKKAALKVDDEKFELIKEGIKHAHDEYQDHLKDLLEEMKVGIDDRIDRIDDILKDLKSQKDDEEDEEKKKEIERQMDSLEEEQKRLADEFKQMEDFLEAQAKVEETIELLRVDVQDADDEDNWLKTFSDLLEEEVPYRLMKYYNVSMGGCLGDDESKYPEAKVTCVSTTREQSKLPFDECELDFEHRYLLN